MRTSVAQGSFGIQGPIRIEINQVTPIETSAVTPVIQTSGARVMLPNIAPLDYARAFDDVRRAGGRRARGIECVPGPGRLVGGIGIDRGNGGSNVVHLVEKKGDIAEVAIDVGDGFRDRSPRGYGVIPSVSPAINRYGPQVAGPRDEGQRVVGQSPARTVHRSG